MSDGGLENMFTQIPWYTKICSKCNEALEECAKYCSNCGIKFGSLSGEASNSCSRNKVAACRKHRYKDIDNFCIHCGSPTTKGLERQKNA